MQETSWISMDQYGYGSALNPYLGDTAAESLFAEQEWQDLTHSLNAVLDGSLLRINKAQRNASDRSRQG